MNGLCQEAADSHPYLSVLNKELGRRLNVTGALAEAAICLHTWIHVATTFDGQKAVRRSLGMDGFGPSPPPFLPTRGINPARIGTCARPHRRTSPPIKTRIPYKMRKSQESEIRISDSGNYISKIDPDRLGGDAM